MSKIVGTQVPVWLSNGYTLPQELVHMDPVKAISLLTLYHADMSEHGWIRVGEAEVTITLGPDEEMLQSQLESLRIQKAEYQKEAIQKLEEFNHRIQQLLALPAPQDTGTDDGLNDDNHF